MELYLALGDSITAGYGVAPAFSFPNCYANFLRQRNPNLCMINLGVNGLTTGGLLNELRVNMRARRLVAQATLITITIGSNDFLHLVNESNQSVDFSQVPFVQQTLMNNLQQIGQEIRCLNPRAVVKVAALYNPLPAGPYVQYYEQVQVIIDKANEIICLWARQFRFVFVNLDRALKGREVYFIANDYIHPNASGYREIADVFARC